MDFRRLIPAVVVLTAVSALCIYAPAQQPSSGAAEPRHPAVDVRRAAAAMKLARLDRQRAIEANEAVANTVPAAEVARREQAAATAEADYEKAFADWQASPNYDALQKLENQSAEADAELLKALAARRITPDAVTDGDLERLRLVAEIARYDACRQRAACDVQAELADLQWQAAQLRDELLRLRVRLDQFTQEKSPRREP